MSRSIISTKLAMPAVRQNRSKLAPISRQASFTPDATAAAGVISLLMALLSFVDSAPRAYRLKAGNADPPISTMGGTSPIAKFSTVFAYDAIDVYGNVAIVRTHHDIGVAATVSGK